MKTKRWFPTPSRLLPACFLAASLLSLSACSDDDDNTTPAPEEETTYTLKLKQTAIAERMRVDADGIQTNLTEAETENMFGERVRLSTPEELRFKDDSLYIVKPEGLTEAYRTKREGDRLLLFNDVTDGWTSCGRFAAPKQFLLNTGYFLGKKTNANRSLYMVGQDYALEVSPFLGGRTSTGSWLKMTYLFE